MISNSQLLETHTANANRIVTLKRELADNRLAAEQLHRSLAAEVETEEQLLVEMQATKLFRVAAPFRRVYGTAVRVARSRRRP